MKNAVVFLIALMLAHAATVMAQSGALEKIRKTGAITMGYVKGSAPFSSADKDQPEGYSVDLCREVAAGVRAQLGLASLETRWIELTLQDRIEAVRSGRVDIECSTTTWTLARQKEVDFSLITFVDGASILTRTEADLGRLADFGGKRIAVISGTTTEKVLKESLERHAVGAAVLLVNTRDAAMQLLEQGKADGFASDRIVLMGLARRGPTPGAFKLLDEDFSVEPYALVLPRGDHEFRLAVNRALARLYRTGGIDAIYKRWLAPFGSPSLLLSAAYFIQGLSE